LENNPNRTTAVIFNAIDSRKQAFELSPLLMTLVSHDEVFPTDDQWSLLYAYAVNAAMDGVPMIFYGQEMGAQNDYDTYAGRTDFSEGISPLNNFDRYELNFGKSIPHFKRYNHMTNIWNAASWKETIRGVYGRFNQARLNSPALRSQQNYFLADASTDGWNPDIFAVAKFQQPGVSAATQDVVIAFINNDFRANQSRAASFKLNAVTDGPAPTGSASSPPTPTTWWTSPPPIPPTCCGGPASSAVTLIANGIYVGFQTNDTFLGGQAQFIRLLDITAGMTPPVSMTCMPTRTAIRPRSSRDLQPRRLRQQHAGLLGQRHPGPGRHRHPDLPERSGAQQLVVHRPQ
jgi:hypothetical protein